MNIPILTITMKSGKLVSNMSHQLPAAERPKVTTPLQIPDILNPLFEGLMEYRERFVVLMLNRNNKVMCAAIISDGGVSSSLVDPKIVFQHALMANASGIVLCHNHPSGNLAPSGEDTVITRKLTEAGRFLDIIVMDHIILTADGFYSFADNGLL